MQKSVKKMEEEQIEPDGIAITKQEMKEIKNNTPQILESDIDKI